MKRLFYLDNVKVLLTLLVIFHHAALPYSVFSSWPYSPSNTEEMMPWIWHFHSVNASFFMGLYFMISGYFVPKSFDSQGVSLFVQKKLIRLGIPIVVVGCIMSIITGQLEVGHLWFLESLLLFCLVYALVRMFFKPIGKDCRCSLTFARILFVGIVMGIGGCFIRLASPQDNWIWILGVVHIEPAHYLQYMMMFVLGVLCYRFQWLDNMKNNTGTISLGAGIALVIGNYLREGGAWDDFVSEWFGIYESLLCVFISFGILWAFRECVNRTNGWWEWCARQSYGAYIFHLFILLAIQYATDSIQLPGMAKFLLIGVLTSVFSFFFTGLIRKLPLVKRVI